MDKREFLNILREALNGEIPPFEIEKHINYYEEYLSDTADGKTEEEKLREIGEPRLIARTIIAASEMKTESNGNRNFEEDRTEDAEFNNSHVKFASWNSMIWYQKILLGLIGILLIIVIVGLLWLGLNLFFSVILPILIVFFVVRLVIGLWRRY